MAQIFLNNCYATLAQAISASDTTLQLSGMNGFPASLGAGDFFLLTLFADTTRYGENIEVVKVTGLSGTTATVERGFEGEALAHAANERVEARLTAETLRNLTPTWKQVDKKPTEFPPESHNHDTRYYTKSQAATSAQGSKADSAIQPSDLSRVATTGDYNDLSGKPEKSAVPLFDKSLFGGV